LITMAVSLPTAADVRKVREQAAKNAAERAEVARTPLLAFLGAGDLAVTAVTKAVADARTRAVAARTRATAQAEDVQHRVAELPQRLSTDELRKVVADVREQAEQAYVGFAERGEKAWGRIRKQPQVKQALATIESYTEKLDTRVDDLVDDAHDAAEKALATVTTQTRSTGERVARATQRLTGRAAETVTEASKDASKAVADAGAEVAENITEAGADVAHEARSTTRKAANRTAPTTAPKASSPTPAARKPATRRIGPADASSTKSGS
jgi:heparin binding hemagglutinin HbhA